MEEMIKQRERAISVRQRKSVLGCEKEVTCVFESQADR